ncbi:hypothetical protein D9M69_519720 [compost metagenome]
MRLFTPPLRKRSPQCIGKKAWPGRTLSSLATATTIAPRLLFRLTRSPGCRRWRRSSSGCRLNSASLTWPNSCAAVPVRLMPCHWSRSRPVIRVSGKRASRCSLAARYGSATNCARPLAVANTPSTYSRAVPSTAPAGKGHCCGPRRSISAWLIPDRSRSRP